MVWHALQSVEIVVAFNGLEVGQRAVATPDFVRRYGSYIKVLGPAMMDVDLPEVPDGSGGDLSEPGEGAGAEARGAADGAAVEPRGEGGKAPRRGKKLSDG